MGIFDRFLWMNWWSSNFFSVLMVKKTYLDTKLAVSQISFF